MSESSVAAAAIRVEGSSGLPVSAGTRIKAFALDYLLIAGYLIVLAGVGSLLTFSPVGWQEFMADPVQADFVAFLVTILPVTLYFALTEASEERASWGKRRVGVEVVDRGCGRIGIRRSLLRSGLKFLPWQMAHTAVLHIRGSPMSPGEPPVWSTPLLVATWSLAAIYVLGLTRIGGGRPLYDRVAGTTVTRRSAEGDD